MSTNTDSTDPPCPFDSDGNLVPPDTRMDVALPNNENSSTDQSNDTKQPAGGVNQTGGRSRRSSRRSSAAVGPASNGHRPGCGCLICKATRAKIARGGYAADAAAAVARASGRAKPNGHRPNCSCHICMAMSCKSRAASTTATRRPSSARSVARHMKGGARRRARTIRHRASRRRRPRTHRRGRRAATRRRRH